ncbi:MAG: A24 family peptidase [Pseudomonadales bacterium]|nr:A24 family peptidase [Pseudomonadales bacterium]
MAIAALLDDNPALLLVCTLLLGLLIGSFLNVLIYRLPIMMQREWHAQCCELLEIEDRRPTHDSHSHFDLIRPGSHCPHCGHAISALENIPILSYLLQRGRCAHCDGRISPRYPFIEGLTALLSAIVAWHFGFGWLTLAVLLLTWGLLALTMIDLDQQVLPDDLTLPLLWLGLIVNSFGYLASLESALYGAVSGYLLLWAVYWLFKLATGKEGMGYGDFKLLAMLGAWLGWQFLPQIILLSSLVGLLVSIVLMVFRGHDRNVPIPFGPYLAGAGFITLIWGGDIASFTRNIL